ncbi:unnamed protein product [Musa acuminata subsp. burmannicoides]
MEGVEITRVNPTDYLTQQKAQVITKKATATFTGVDVQTPQKAQDRFICALVFEEKANGTTESDTVNPARVGVSTPLRPREERCHLQSQAGRHYHHHGSAKITRAHGQWPHNL